eukprot:412143_1
MNKKLIKKKTKIEESNMGLALVKLICGKCSVMTGAFTHVKKQISIWVPPAEAKWYWMDWEELKWIPYRDVDQQILNQAYRNREEKCNVANGKYRVEFVITGSHQPWAGGNQFDNNTLMLAGVNNPIIRIKPYNNEKK